ncbi:MAG: PqqD family protein [Deltaproteobacteria bacterium]|nr:PqqD family protein [Deltaproteobacteria bacterium]
MKVTIPDDVVFRDLAGEAVILNLASGTYFGLNEVGTRMWHLLAEHGETEPVLATVLAEYEVEEAPLRQDLDALLHILVEKGLIVVTPEQTTTAR